MELLLILSAMLSAVTGAFTGVRGPEGRLHPAEAAVQVAASVVEEQAEAAAPTRPVEARPSTVVPALPSFAILPAIALDAVKLIE